MSLETLESPAKTRTDYVSQRPAPSRKRIAEGYISLPFMVIECGLVFLLGFLIADIYVGKTLGETNYYNLYITPLLIGPIILASLFQRNGLYEVVNLQHVSLVALKLMKTTGLCFVFLILLSSLAGIGSEYSRLWFFTWAVSSIALVIVVRSFVSQILSNLSNLEIQLSRVAIFGDSGMLQEVAEAITKNNSAVQVIGLFSEDRNKGHGTLSDLIRLGQQTEIDRIIIAKNRIQREEISRIIGTLSILPSEVDIHPGFLGDTVKIFSVNINNATTTIRVQNKPIPEWGLLAKATFDRITAFIGLVALAPLFALVALAIKLDSKGPVFFKQTRHGYNQKQIDVWKFRTMTVMENGDAFRQTRKNDARVTRVGSFLRKTSIDELPQLINVLTGSMSIVGPRPHAIAMNEEFGTRLMRYNNRHKVKPGITGWAQINGYRGPTDQPGQMDKRVEYDLDYIENWSFAFDIKIILATPYYGLISKNAF